MRRSGTDVGAPAGTPLRMPAEWEPHAATLMGWPCRRELWGARLGEARDAYAATARAIARFEPVVMLATPEDAGDASAYVGSPAGGIPPAGDPTYGIEVWEMALDDSWLRDTGPLFVHGAGGTVAGVDFGFNAWGGKFEPYGDDAALAGRVLERIGVPRVDGAMVLEGGAISVDGEGTLVTTEQCLLNPNRNPGMGRAEIEARLHETLGADVVIWLDRGLVEDRDTDGHVDGVCMFTAPGVVVLQTVADADDPNAANVAENRRRLAYARDAAGRRLEVIEIDALPRVSVDGETFVCPYTNFYVCNGGVVVPTTGAPTDAAVLERLGEAFPDRDVVGVDGTLLAKGGGGVHCITQQVPV